MPFLSNPIFGGGDLMQRMQMMTALQAIQNSKVDRKLYVGNIPQNITPTAVIPFNLALRPPQQRPLENGHQHRTSWAVHHFRVDCCGWTLRFHGVPHS